MDHTQHVLDTIDGALADWSTSGDAMRWTPDEPREAKPARPVLVPAPDPEAVRRLWEQLRDAIRPFVAWAEQAAHELEEKLRAVGHLPEPLPTDPRERALWLAQHRNTGPDRDLTRQRRPRLHHR
jgi:hypothetical protein